MFKSLPNLKKKTLDRSHDEFQLPSLLYIDKTPQRSNLPNTSNNFHHKLLQIVNSLLQIDPSYCMTRRIQTRQLFNTSNALRVFPDFPSNPRILLRHYPLIPLIRFLQPDPVQALRWSIRHQLWSTRGDRVDRKSGVVAYEEDPRAGLCVVHGVASTSRQRKRVR